MKRITAIILSVIFTLTIFGCGARAEQTKPDNGTDKQPANSEKENATAIAAAAEGSTDKNDENTEMPYPGASDKTLVVYFSATGTTKRLAEYAADVLNADIYEITAQNPYTEEDLAYYTDCRADKEQNDPSARPAIAEMPESLEQYDTIILGYPIWHGQAPRIISTFLESYDFAGKTILPFCTSHSSGLGSSDKDLYDLCSAEWLAGKRIPTDSSEDDIKEWLNDMGIDDD